MPDEASDHPPITELSQGDFEASGVEGWADLLKSATQAVDSIIEETNEEQRKIKEAYEHRKNISEEISRLETLRDVLEEYEKDARRSAMAEEMGVDREIVDNLTRLAEIEPPDLDLDPELEVE